jgi:hypothetical protein
MKFIAAFLATLFLTGVMATFPRGSGMNSNEMSGMAADSEAPDSQVRPIQAI